MSITGNKKVLIMYILDILKKYATEDKALTQQEIIRKLESEYGLRCDRRTVKSNIMTLIDIGYDISMDKGYYLQSSEFDDAELRLLIDSVLFSKNISSKKAKQLIDKLKKLSNEDFAKKVPHVFNVDTLYHTDNKQVMITLDLLNEAIVNRRKVLFTYNKYGTDFKLHPKYKEKYKVNPYQLVANNGRYYLIANYDKYNDLSHYRIDKISNVELLTDEVCKEITTIDGFTNGFDLSKYMTEHIYTYGGHSEMIRLYVDKKIVDELVDWFGKNFKVIKEDEKGIEVHLRCNVNAIKYWALQYGMYAEVLGPKKLREDIKKIIFSMQEKYKDS